MSPRERTAEIEPTITIDFIDRFLFGLIQYWCYYINSVALKSDQYLIYSFP